VFGLVCAGRTFKNSSAIKKACDFLLSKELPSGGWGESYLSCQDKVTSLPETGSLQSVFMFAECIFSDTRQTSSLPSDMKKHSVK